MLRIAEVAGPKGPYVVADANERLHDVNQWVDTECPGLEEFVWSHDFRIRPMVCEDSSESIEVLESIERPGLNPFPQFLSCCLSQDISPRLPWFRFYSNSQGRSMYRHW